MQNDPVFEIVRPEAVNVKTKGYPWLAGIVANVSAEIVKVLFPGAQKPGPFDYTQDQVLSFQTQFPEGRFKPISKQNSRPLCSQRKMIKTYEERLFNYLNTNN